jgi:hypothetical protein
VNLSTGSTTTSLISNTTNHAHRLDKLPVAMVSAETPRFGRWPPSRPDVRSAADECA